MREPFGLQPWCLTSAFRKMSGSTEFYPPSMASPKGHGNTSLLRKLENEVSIWPARHREKLRGSITQEGRKSLRLHLKGAHSKSLPPAHWLKVGSVLSGGRAGAVCTTRRNQPCAERPSANSTPGDFLCSLPPAPRPPCNLSAVLKI